VSPGLPRETNVWYKNLYHQAYSVGGSSLLGLLLLLVGNFKKYITMVQKCSTLTLACHVGLQYCNGPTPWSALNVNIERCKTWMRSVRSATIFLCEKEDKKFYCAAGWTRHIFWKRGINSSILWNKEDEQVYAVRKGEYTAVFTGARRIKAIFWERKDN
jgi:hypothetical protein